MGKHRQAHIVPRHVGREQLTRGSLAFDRHRLTLALRSDLETVAAVMPLDEAWQKYEAMLSLAHGFDLRQVSAVEVAFEDPADQEVTGGLPRGLETVTEAIEDELSEAWARLRARSLVDVLRESGDSLRSIATAVQVSAPYLSQLAGGTGPVPSDRVLRKLEEGLIKRRLRRPQTLPHPNDTLGTLNARLAVARESLADLHTRRLPQVRVEGGDSHQARMLEALFVSLAARLLDSHEGLALKHLLDEVVATDSHNLITVLKILQSDDLLTLHHQVVALPANARVALGALLKSLTANDTSDILPSRPFKARPDTDDYTKGEV